MSFKIFIKPRFSRANDEKSSSKEKYFIIDKDQEIENNIISFDTIPNEYFELYSSNTIFVAKEKLDFLFDINLQYKNTSVDLPYMTGKFIILHNYSKIHENNYGFDSLHTVNPKIILKLNKYDHIQFKFIPNCDRPLILLSNSFIQVTKLSFGI